MDAAVLRMGRHRLPNILVKYYSQENKAKINVSRDYWILMRVEQVTRPKS